MLSSVIDMPISFTISGIETTLHPLLHIIPVINWVSHILNTPVERLEERISEMKRQYDTLHKRHTEVLYLKHIT